MLRTLFTIAICFLVSKACFAEQVTRITIQKPSIRSKLDSTYNAGKLDTIVVWFDNRNGILDETGSPYRILTHVDSGTVILLLPKFEIYQVFAGSGERSGDSTVAAEQDMMSGLGMLSPSETWHITATSDTSTVRDVPCHRFVFSVEDEFGERLSDVWIADRSDEKLSAFQFAYYNLLYFLKGHEAIEAEMKKVHGLPMLEVARGRDRGATVIIAIDTVAVDSNFFAIPTSYEEYK